jgi:acetyl-CoA acetyltransferase
MDNDLFDDELVPVGELTADEGPRRGHLLREACGAEAGLRSRGTTTAGNAPGVNDGAGRS